jgi:methionyl-tRNA formyltransferase
MSKLRLAFMGTPGFAVPALEALIAGGHDVAAAYTQPPRPAGRGQAERRSEVHEAAARHGITVRHPTSLKSAAEQQAFADLGLDAAVVAAYGLILPKAILVAPKLGCLNIHASLLPRWRGAAPIQRAIMAGDAESGVTIMQMDEGLDTGAMLLQERVPITASTTAETLHDALAAMGARLIVGALDGLAAGKLKPKPQPTDGVTYAKKLTREEGVIDWRKPAAVVERQVRAMTPWPGAFFEHGGTRFKVLAAEAELPGTHKSPGTVLDDTLLIACGEGALRLRRVQREGRAAMDAEAFLRGCPLPPGTLLASPADEAPA